MISQTIPKNSQLKRFEALTGLRALAVTLVFIYHNRKYWRGDLHPEIMRLINEFHVGVSIFFVLSGFLIAYNYGDKISSNVREYSRYIIIRMARILPLLVNSYCLLLRSKIWKNELLSIDLLIGTWFFKQVQFKRNCTSLVFKC